MSEEQNNNNNKQAITLKLTERLHNENIVKVFEADSKCIHLILNHTYKDTTVISDIDKKSWQKTTKNFRDISERKGIQREHIDMLDDALAENYQVIGDISNDNSSEDGSTVTREGENEDEKRDNKQVYIEFKYSQNGRGNSYESIILEGIPQFIRYDKESDKFVVVKDLEEPNRILRPPSIQECPFIPYEFANQAELDSYLKRAKEETIVSIHKKWKDIVYAYNRQDTHKLDLITLDILGTYFQDLFPTVHYHGVVGPNGAGKSSIGDTFEYGAYRGVKFTNPSAANVFRVLGMIESGWITLILDEFDKIEDNDIQSILKDGYRNYDKATVPKTNTAAWVQEYYFAYCKKVFLAENSPSQWKARGIIDRTFYYSAFVGKPKYLIEETIRPQGNPKRQARLDHLMDLRKLTLAYRLLHFKDPIEDIEVGVEGRPKQLVKPYIQLFYNTSMKDEIVHTLQRFLNMRTKMKSVSLIAALIPLIQDLLYYEGTKTKDEDGNDCKYVVFSRIWEKIKTDISGTVGSRDDEYITDNYGTLYKNTITKIMSDQFGGNARLSRP